MKSTATPCRCAPNKFIIINVVTCIPVRSTLAPSRLTDYQWRTPAAVFHWVNIAFTQEPTRILEPTQSHTVFPYYVTSYSELQPHPLKYGMWYNPELLDPERDLLSLQKFWREKALTESSLLRASRSSKTCRRYRLVRTTYEVAINLGANSFQ